MRQPSAITTLGAAGSKSVENRMEMILRPLFFCFFSLARAHTAFPVSKTKGRTQCFWQWYKKGESQLYFFLYRSSQQMPARNTDDVKCCGSFSEFYDGKKKRKIRFYDGQLYYSVLLSREGIFPMSERLRLKIVQ